MCLLYDKPYDLVLLRVCFQILQNSFQNHFFFKRCERQLLEKMILEVVCSDWKQVLGQIIFSYLMS